MATIDAVHDAESDSSGIVDIHCLCIIAMPYRIAVGLLIRSDSTVFLAMSTIPNGCESDLEMYPADLCT